MVSLVGDYVSGSGRPDLAHRPPHHTTPHTFPYLPTPPPVPQALTLLPLQETWVLLPAISRWQWHPVTVASGGGGLMTLHIKRYGLYTKVRSLHKLCSLWG